MFNNDRIGLHFGSDNMFGFFDVYYNGNQVGNIYGADDGLHIFPKTHRTGHIGMFDCEFNTIHATVLHGGNSKVQIGGGDTDVYIHNATSGKYLQFRDDGGLSISGDKIPVVRWGTGNPDNSIGLDGDIYIKLV